jgi:hypothetical protein
VEKAKVDGEPNWVRLILERLDKVEALLAELIRQRAVKEWYAIEEAARLLGKAKFAVREWCRHGRVHCRKRNSGRGKHLEWVIAHEELLRIQREGLLPLARTASSIT